MKIKYENLSSKYKAAYAIIKDLENKLESSERSVEQLNESLGSKNSVIDDYDHDIDVWKRDLHEIHSAHLSLQQKVETLQTSTTFILEEPSSTDLDFNSNYSSGAFEGTISCTICECELEDYAPEYYCGRKISPTCDQCKINANLNIGSSYPDPFSSFPAEGMPSTLVGHWIPFGMGFNNSFSSIHSLRTHYVRVPNPGSRFLSTEEVILEMEMMMSRKSQEYGCRQS